MRAVNRPNQDRDPAGTAVRDRAVRWLRAQILRGTTGSYY